MPQLGFDGKLGWARLTERLENVKAKEKKENFVKKFLPTCCANSLGGRQYITGVSSARKRAVEKIQHNGKDIRTSVKRELSSSIHLGLCKTKVKTFTCKEPVIRLFGSTDETTPINNIQLITGEDQATDCRINGISWGLSLAMIRVH